MDINCSEFPLNLVKSLITVINFSIIIYILACKITQI